MRKTFLTKGFVRFSRGLAGAALIAAAIGITSCETHSNSDRNESIKVYADPIAKEPIDAGIVGVKGGLAKLYVDANIDFVATWEDDAATPWAKVVDYSSTDPQTGLRVITLKANRRSTTSSYYTRRTGMLILAASDGELNYNRIIPIHQGSTARVSNDFATLKYGKNGYLKLGDDKGHGADLISPYTNTLRSDSLLMVSFRAVAFTDYMTGARDDNKITVEVLGGGVIRDFAQSEKTTIDLEAGYYDISSEEFPEDMWEGHDFLVFVAGTKANPITANTRVRIICGSLTQNSAVNNRIYLDNFYIRRLQKVEEDYFAENNGSGKDIILGAPFDEEEQE